MDKLPLDVVELVALAFMGQTSPDDYACKMRSVTDSKVCFEVKHSAKWELGRRVCRQWRNFSNKVCWNNALRAKVCFVTTALNPSSITVLAGAIDGQLFVGPRGKFFQSICLNPSTTRDRLIVCSGVIVDDLCLGAILKQMGFPV